MNYCDNAALIFILFIKFKFRLNTNYNCINMKPANDDTDLYGMLEAYKQGQLRELSRIELENVRIEKLTRE